MEHNPVGYLWCFACGVVVGTLATIVIAITLVPQVVGHIAGGG